MPYVPKWSYVLNWSYVFRLSYVLKWFYMSVSGPMSLNGPVSLSGPMSLSSPLSYEVLMWSLQVVLCPQMVLISCFVNIIWVVLCSPYKNINVKVFSQYNSHTVSINHLPSIYPVPDSLLCLTPPLPTSQIIHWGANNGTTPPLSPLTLHYRPITPSEYKFIRSNTHSLI